MCHIGLGVGRVLPDDVQGAQFALFHRVEHRGEVFSRNGIQLAVPGALIASSDLRIREQLEARQPVGQCAHVAAALHVVLASQGHQTRAAAPDMAGQQREVAQREHVLDCSVVLGDAQRPQDLCSSGRGVRVRHLGNGLSRNSSQPLAFVECERLNRSCVVIEARGGMLDEGAVVHSLGDDLAGHRVGKRDICADVEAQPHVRELGRGGAAGIHRVHGCTVVDAPQQVVEEDGVRLACVRSPQQDHIGFGDFLIGARSAPKSEHCRQTDDRRSVSGAITGVDVVRLEHRSHELLGCVVHLVRALRAREHADPTGTVLLGRSPQPGCSTIECIVPASRSKHAAVSYERRVETRKGTLTLPPSCTIPPRHCPSPVGLNAVNPNSTPSPLPLP